jgi:hypothetical protein
MKTGDVLASMTFDRIDELCLSEMIQLDYVVDIGPCLNCAHLQRLADRGHFRQRRDYTIDLITETRGSSMAGGHRSDSRVYQPAQRKLLDTLGLRCYARYRYDVITSYVSTPEESLDFINLNFLENCLRLGADRMT